MKENTSSLLEIQLFSFGFKYGEPENTNICFDVRFLPNPYWVPELRPKTGLEKDISNYVLESQEGKAFLAHLIPMMNYLVGAFARADKEKLIIGIGCTGGHHRSVSVVEKLAGELGEGLKVTVTHRDIHKDNG